MFLLQKSTDCGKVESGKVLDDGITLEDLLYALYETRPSVSTKEQQKYQRM